MSDRRGHLLHAKLTALVKEHLGGALPATASEQSSFGRGAALTHDNTAWVLLDEQPERGLGGALAWALRQPEVEHLAVIADSATGLLARRAALFDYPISVWAPVERTLLAAIAEPYADNVALPDHHEVWWSQIVAAGADPVVEHGVLCGEVRGLEVCRVVDDPSSGQTRLEVGVGAHDRDAYLTMHAGRSIEESLAHVIAAVAEQRQVGQPLHPLNRFAKERFLRWQLLDDPGLIGAASLQPAPPPVPRLNVKDPVPCVALGHAVDGAALVVVCSSGVDLDLVPTAVDARGQLDPAARLVIVAPQRDVLAVTEALLARAAGANHAIIRWAQSGPALCP